MLQNSDYVFGLAIVVAVCSGIYLITYISRLKKRIRELEDASRRLIEKEKKRNRIIDKSTKDLRIILSKIDDVIKVTKGGYNDEHKKNN